MPIVASSCGFVRRVKFLHLGEGTELTQGAGLELADALLADPQLLADLHEGLGSNGVLPAITSRTGET
jgi:hypothetical protein